MAVKKQFNNFEELLAGSEIPLVVDFYADWCGPCRIMNGILDQVQAQLKQKVQVVKINTEKYSELASQYQIYALPTLVVFKNGQPVERMEGVLPPEKIIQRLQALI